MFRLTVYFKNVRKVPYTVYVDGKPTTRKKIFNVKSFRDIPNEKEIDRILSGFKPHTVLKHEIRLE